MATLRDYTNRMKTLISMAGPDLAAKKAELDYDFIQSDIEKLLTSCQDGAERVRNIVKSLKIFASHDESPFQPVNINECIEASLNLIGGETRGRIEIEKSFSKIPEIEGQAGPLNQVFVNILVNAAQAIPKTGKITIRTTQAGPNIVVSISDNGVGIPKENLTKLFDPFFSTKPVGEGTGLGLSISYGIIEKHLGRIEVDSKVNVGTEFRVILPISQQKTATVP